ncbi:aldo/keto reductase [Crossiella sp. CA-258035]|uniref:aldo/keto reductase n=1 Tax=Crossiella sp. CA-258035 TaxID=2981138 RepID=UPI0024BD0592|nr:aldo/keto reductase [Crossiella sp. CA-258035]WHT23337.1 aldo/keto reductase [Crossiella sp. CA-258035]
MEYRKVGASGLSVSEIIYGNLRYPGDADEAELVAHARAALDAGVTTFDTADIYGLFACESALGVALENVPRDSVEIITKVGFPIRYEPNGRGLSRKHVLEAVEGSLRRLRTDHIDVYIAHRYDEETPLEETMLTFSDLVRAGKIRYMGISEWEIPQIRRAVELARELRVPLIANSVRYSMVWRVAEPEVFPACAELGIGILPYFALEQGVLTGKYAVGAPPPAGSRATDMKGGRAPVMQRMLSDEVLSRVQQLNPLAEELELTTAQLAIAWALRDRAVSGLVLGASRPEQFAQNAAAAGVTLETEVIKRIDEILEPVVLWTDPDLADQEGGR